MRKPSAAIILSVMLAFSWVGFLVINSGVAQEERNAATKWGYSIAIDEQELMKKGQDGWEAYAVTRRDHGSTPFFYLKKAM